MSGVLAGKVALVTGARTGIGAATVRALAAQGASVIACGRRPGDCTALVEEITAAGGSVRDHALDVADLAATAARIASAVALFGRIDVIVNNAATIEPMAPIDVLDPLAFDLAMRTNVSGVAAIVTAAWPHLRGGGRVINLLSGAATRPLHGWAAYCSTKAALLMLTRAIDLEGTPHAIRCFGVAPGLVDTAMQASIRQANINAVSAIAQSDLAPANQPAALIAWIATGAADDLAGTMIDMRDPALTGSFSP